MDMTPMEKASKTVAETSAWLRANGAGHHADGLDADAKAFLTEWRELDTKAEAALQELRRPRGFWARLFR